MIPTQTTKINKIILLFKDIWLPQKNIPQSTQPQLETEKIEVGVLTWEQKMRQHNSAFLF